MEYSEEDYLMLSGIQHFEFCKRQWALIHVEHQWEENYRTVDGRILHEKAHDDKFTEKRGNVIITRGMPVASRSMGVKGVCDLVEFIRDDDLGVEIFGRDGRYRVEPVEYKRGRPKETDMDILQLTAQAMCLEEMLCCRVFRGSLFYGETRRRLSVDIRDDLKKQVRSIFEEMHKMFVSHITPAVRPIQGCNSCSLNNICLPNLVKQNKSVKDYIAKRMREIL